MTLTSPALAQTTTDDVLAGAQAEAVLVISETAFNVWGTIFAGFIALVGIVATTALMLVHRSTPQWAHMPMIVIAEKALDTLQKLAEKTETTIDDKMVLAVRTAYNAFLDTLIIADEDANDEELEHL
jgi:hypothetical protein